MKQTWRLNSNDIEYIVREHIRRLNGIEPSVKMLTDNPATEFLAEVTIEKDYVATRGENVRG